jgi:hypothetical protein
MKKSYIFLTLITLFAMAQLPGFAQDWNIQTIDPSADIRETHIQLDNSGYPHVVYEELVNSQTYFKYASWNGVAWEIESVPSNEYASHAKFCLDQNNNPHIIHQRSINQYKHLFYTYRNTSGNLITTTIEVDYHDIISVYYRNGILEFITECGGAMYQFINSSSNNFTKANIGILESGSSF